VDLYNLSEEKSLFTERYEISEFLSWKIGFTEKATIGFFKQFGWLDPNPTMIQKDQQELLCQRASVFTTSVFNTSLTPQVAKIPA